MHKTPEITRLIHENFWIVLSYALAQPRARKLLEDKFKGGWEILNRSIYELAEIRADRALLEMATQFRVLDDDQDLSGYLKMVEAEPLGTVTQADGTATPLHFRDMTNKVVHGSRFEWILNDEPSVVCHSGEPTRWLKAEIKIVPLMALVGVLLF